MPMMCEECKCSNWYCQECGESNHHDCDCSCCGCKCQTQPTQPKGSTMTMINQEPIAPTQEELLRIDLEGSRSIAEGLRKTINTQRGNISTAFTLINDYIEANDLTIEDDIPLSELNDILHQSLGSTLVFDKEYVVEGQWYVYGTFTVRAASEEDAQRQVEEITMYEPSFDEDSDDVTIEFDRVVSLERKG